MITDHTIVIDDTPVQQLPMIAQMEQDEDTRGSIIPYSLERHRREHAKSEIFYKSIYTPKRRLIGFLILACAPDSQGVEFRRIVIQQKGQGYGKQAVRLIDRICAEELGRKEVWLDVFEDNDRARHIYESSGYEPTSQTEHQGRALRVYRKTIKTHKEPGGS